MICKLITYGSLEYSEMVSLRYKILRKPLSLTFSENDLLKDKEDILIGCFDEKSNTLVGCCILSKKTEDTIQLRQMAVAIQYQRHNLGIGSQLIFFVEKLAKNEGYNDIYLHAREVAVGFYKKNGYTIQGDSFEEVGIPHFEMIKTI